MPTKIVVPAPTPAKVRRNIYLPQRLNVVFAARARELGYDFTTALVMAMHDWSYTASGRVAASRDAQPAVASTKGLKKTRRADDTHPHYTASNLAVATWAQVEAAARYMETHPKATAATVAAALQLQPPVAEAAYDAVVTEWYADQVERMEAK